MPKFTLYHESNQQFGFPDLDAMRVAESTSDRGALGLWASISNGPPRGDGLWGKHLYEVKVEVENTEVRLLPMPEVTQFEHENADDCKNRFAVWREQLIESGYKLVVVAENDHSTKQAIILDFSIIKSFAQKDRTP